MKILFIENFKGFDKKFFEFKDFNFFVGENSTGKTSLLSLINLVSQPSFWFSPEFNTNDIELGLFNEIVNKNITGTKFFRIGIYFGTKKDKNTETGIPDSVLLTFKEKDANPVISELKYTFGPKTIYVKIGEKETRYKIKDSIQFSEKESEWFTEWILDNQFGDSYSVLKIGSGRNSLPLAVIKNMIEVESAEKIQTNNSKSFSFRINALFTEFTWIAPIRAKAKRVYESFKFNTTSEGEHIPILLKKILLTEQDSKKNKEIKRILEDFGRESSLFDKIEIKELGTDKGAPFEINILYQGIPIKLPNVGYGVSQILPILVEILSSKQDTIAIQQPEVHLHPKAQSAFGQFIYNSNYNNKNRFIIETHSDYTIDRFRFNLGEDNSVEKPEAQVVFFERENGGTNFRIIPILNDGNYSDEQPENFRKFFIDEQIKMLGL